MFVCLFFSFPQLRSLQRFSVQHNFTTNEGATESSAKVRARTRREEFLKCVLLLKKTQYLICCFNCISRRHLYSNRNAHQGLCQYSSIAWKKYSPDGQSFTGLYNWSPCVLSHITASMLPSGDTTCPLQKPLPTSNHSRTLLEVSGKGRVASR